MLKDRVCLGEEPIITIVEQVPYGLIAQTLDLGLYNVCSSMYKD